MGVAMAGTLVSWLPAPGGLLPDRHGLTMGYMLILML
jgi:hypothetical protein